MDYYAIAIPTNKQKLEKEIKLWSRSSKLVMMENAISLFHMRQPHLYATPYLPYSNSSDNMWIIFILLIYYSRKNVGIETL